MLDVAQSKKKKDVNIVPSAQYNVGRAYFMVSVMCSQTQTLQFCHLLLNRRGLVSVSPIPRLKSGGH